MNVNAGDQESVNLLPRNVIMKQSPDMVLFTITDRFLVYADDPREGIRMTITLKRKIMSEMMTTYFPSLLLMMITYATTFFKPFFFEAALSVNLTTMLVMTTIFISKMEGLPPTSATKMIDYWLILCQLVPFAQVVLLTIKENLREEEQEDNIAKEKDLIEQPLTIEDNLMVNVEDDTSSREAWTMSKIKLPTAGSLKMLTMIGKAFIFILNFSQKYSFRKESAATDCALCLYRLLCNRCKFLF